MSEASPPPSSMATVVLYRPPHARNAAIAARALHKETKARERAETRCISFARSRELARARPVSPLAQNYLTIPHDNNEPADINSIASQLGDRFFLPVTTWKAEGTRLFSAQYIATQFPCVPGLADVLLNAPFVKRFEASGWRISADFSISSAALHRIGAAKRAAPNVTIDYMFGHPVSHIIVTFISHVDQNAYSIWFGKEMTYFV